MGAASAPHTSPTRKRAQLALPFQKESPISQRVDQVVSLLVPPKAGAQEHGKRRESYEKASSLVFGGAADKPRLCLCRGLWVMRQKTVMETRGVCSAAFGSKPSRC